MRDDEPYDDGGHRGRRTLPRRSGLLGAALASTALLAAACSGAAAQPGAGGAASPTSAASRALAYSQCMRAHGISDFPDPNRNGGIGSRGPGTGGDLQPTNPKNEAAQKACQSLAGSGGTPAQQAANYAAELRYANCMRSHGEPNFPDPKAPGSGPNSQSQSGGGNTGSSGNGVDPSSPQFISANKACEHYLPAGNQPGNNSNGGAGS
jgi:hypothetical protein